MLATHLERLVSALRARWFTLRGSTVGANCTLASGVRLRPGVRQGQRGAIIIGARCEFDRGVLLDAWGGRIEVSPNVWFGPYSVIYGHGGVTIGRDTLISMHCRILSSNHAVPPIAVTIRSQPDDLRQTAIGADVWLGAGVTVLGGVTIGNGCIVGAGAVVTHDLLPGSIALGVPARVTGCRPPA